MRSRFGGSIFRLGIRCMDDRAATGCWIGSLSRCFTRKERLGGFDHRFLDGMALMGRGTIPSDRSPIIPGKIDKASGIVILKGPCYFVMQSTLWGILPDLKNLPGPRSNPNDGSWESGRIACPSGIDGNRHPEWGENIDAGAGSASWKTAGVFVGASMTEYHG